MSPDLPVWAEVDTGCIRRNVERLKARLSPGTMLLAVVKANGYGHGDVPAARAAVAGGAEWLGVARVSEGAALRAAGIEAPVLLLAEPPRGSVAQAVALDLTPTIYTREGLGWWGECARDAGRAVAVHMKVDTGMHRYGVAPEQAAAFAEEIRKEKGLQLAGVWSHFAVAEDVLNPFTREQHRRFLAVAEDLRRSGAICHLSNSAGLLSFPDAHLDMVRTGICIYGIHPSPELSGRVELEPAMALKAGVGMVKRLQAGEAVSYGQRYVLDLPGWVVSVPCGYADGLSRAAGAGGAEVLIAGKRRPIAGAVTMDHFMAFCGDDEVERGAEVVILGRQGGEEITAGELAARAGTIPYEVVCGIGPRVPRFYAEAEPPPAGR